MLTEEEKGFIRYWEQNRNKKKRIMWQLAAGLPFAAFLVLAIFISVFSNWYTGALAAIKMDQRLILVLLVAVILIVAFIVVFSAHHRWDMNEQHYKELLSRKDQS